MDELIAAAEAVSMDVEMRTRRPGIMEQRGLYGTASDAGALPLICDMETTTNNKENNEAHAVAREVEHAASKVSNAPHIRHPTQCLIRAALCPV